MKNQNQLTKLTLLLSALLTLAAVSARADILPTQSVEFSPVGIAMDQTARLNLLNLGVPGGLFVSWSVIDASGNTVTQSAVTLPLGQIVSLDYKRQLSPLRSEMRIRVDVLGPSVPAGSLRTSLEVFNNATGATSVFMGGAIP